MAHTIKLDMKIGYLAEAAGVPVETIRYYQRIGIMPTPSREYGTVRRYGNEALVRLSFIKQAQSLGFSLAEIKLLLESFKAGRFDEVRAITARKTRVVEAQIDNLRAVQAVLNRLVGACNGNGESCPIVERLSQPKSRQRGRRSIARGGKSRA